MFPKNISQNIDTLVSMHEKVFPQQPTPMSNKASFYQYILQISASQVYLFSCNEFPRISKSRRHLLYEMSTPLNYFRNVFILGFSIFVGLSIPNWISSQEESVFDTGSLTLDRLERNAETRIITQQQFTSCICLSFCMRGNRSSE